MNNAFFTPIQVRLAGVTFGDCQANIRKWGCPDIGTYAVIREPNNPHDPNAILISSFFMYNMGYLPRWVSAKLAPLMDTGRKFLAEFVRVNEYPPYENIGLTVRIVETTA